MVTSLVLHWWKRTDLRNGSRFPSLHTIFNLAISQRQTYAYTSKNIKNLNDKSDASPKSNRIFGTNLQRVPNFMTLESPQRVRFRAFVTVIGDERDSALRHALRHRLNERAGSGRYFHVGARILVAVDRVVEVGSGGRRRRV